MNDPLQFVADSAMASELALGLLLQTLAEHHPEILRDFSSKLSALLQSNLPSAGARDNLSALLASLGKKMPTGG